MAEENLGKAVLTIEINDDQAQATLRTLREDINKLNTSTGRASARQTAKTSGTTDPTQKLTQAEERLAAVRSRSLVAAEKEAQQRQKDLRGRVSGAISSGIIGGGFPLLFGQGVGAAAGGLAGGVAGGALGGGFGFGLSVVGTALGAAFDEAINKAKTLATGLQDPIGQFGALQQASLLSGKSVEKQAESLIAAGRQAEAAALIQRDLATSYGDISDLTTLSESFDQLTRIFAQLSVTTAQFIAGPLTEFLDRLAGALTIKPERQKQIESEATAAVAAKTGPLGIKGSGFFGAIEVQFNGKTYAGSATGIRQAIITDLVRKDLENIRGTAAAAAAAPTTVQVDSDTKRAALFKAESELITAQIQGHKAIVTQRRIELSLAQEALDIDNLRAANVGEPVIQKRQQEGNRERQELFKLQQKLNAQDDLNIVQNNIKLQSIQKQIEATQALSQAESGVERSTLSTVQAINAGIAAAQRREQELGAQISAARQIGDEKTASDLVNQQAIAAQETKLAIEQGALALKEAGEKLAQDAKNARDSLRSAKEGAFSLLRRGEQLSLLRQARSDIREAGVFDPRKIARLSERELVSAGSSARAITQAQNELDSIEEAYSKLSSGSSQLSTNLDATNTALVNLASITQALADKNWNVNVTVQGGQASTYGDLVNSGLAP